MSINIIVKLIATPFLIILCDLFSAVQINYASLSQAVILGVFVALTNIGIEYLMLTRGTLWVTTIVDFVVTMTIIYSGSMMYTHAWLSTYGALIITLLITVMEYFLHRGLLRKDWGTPLMLGKSRGQH